MTAINEFCETRGLGHNIREAFTAYIRAEYVRKYMIKVDGDTINMVVKNITHEEVGEAWGLFVNEMKRFLSD